MGLFQCYPNTKRYADILSKYKVECEDYTLTGTELRDLLEEHRAYQYCYFTKENIRVELRSKTLYLIVNDETVGSFKKKHAEELIPLLEKDYIFDYEVYIQQGKYKYYYKKIGIDSSELEYPIILFKLYYRRKSLLRKLLERL